MGGLLSRVLDALSSRHPSRILLLGLDAAGKTTVLYRLNLGETVRTIPTVGFNVENVQYKNLEMTIWDVGGQDKIRALWKYYYQNTDALVFVVDSSDTARLGVAAEELSRLLAEPELQNIPVLVYANKQDLPDATSVANVADKMGLHALRSREWFIQASSAASGDGLYEGLDWLNTTMERRRRR